MNIFKQFAWRALGFGAPAAAVSLVAAPGEAGEAAVAATARPTPHGVAPLSSSLGAAPAAGLGPSQRDVSKQPGFPCEDGTPAPPSRDLPAGLMDLPPLRAFLDANHFGLGRHNGSNLRTADARDHGVRALIAEFQAIVCTLDERKQAEIDRLEDALLETEGVCEITARRLRARIQIRERERNILRTQLELSEQAQGWVRQPVSRYQLGFTQGLRAAMDAEHLGL